MRRCRSKANSADVDGLRKETTSKLDEFQQDSNTKFGNVSSEISGLKQDLVATTDELGPPVGRPQERSQRGHREKFQSARGA
jgi:hypothetical protein